jgi:hypothetical protein
MAIEFVEQHKITVKSKGQTATLLAREPNALEGARYMAALQRHGAGVRATDPDAFEATIALHIGLLVACVEGSEDFTPAFPAGGTEAERRAWLLRLSWADVSPIATAVMGLGFPPTSAGSSGETTPG